MKSLIIMLLCAVSVTAQEKMMNDKDVKAQIEREIVGQSYYLKIEVILLVQKLGQKDVTYLWHDLKPVYHYLRIQERDAYDFFAASNYYVPGSLADRPTWPVLHERGTKTEIVEIKFKSKQVEIKVEIPEQFPVKIKLKFEDKPTLVGFQTAFDAVFARSKNEVPKMENSSTIRVGMRADEIERIKGEPSSRVKISDRDVFSYPDAKFFFMHDRLIAIQ